MKRLLLLLPLLLALLAAGCAGSRSAEERSTGYYLPEVPFFLSGPMGVLLTNAGGFSARVTATSGLAHTPETLTGQLLCRDSLFLFAPDLESLSKRLRPMGLSFIWDVKENRGFVLIEAMQGYAPIGFNVHYTNILIVPAMGQSDRLEGHPCTAAEARVDSSEGASTTFQLTQATDLKGLPLRLSGGPKAAPQSLSLSRLRPQIPPAELFRPPEGFTRYDNADLLLSELTLRQHNLKRRSGEEYNDWTPGTPTTPTSPYPRTY